MSATIPWRYSLLDLPLDAQVVWIRRDAWSDRPHLATFAAVPPAFSISIDSPGGLHITDLTVPAYAILCWRSQSLADQDAWTTSAP